MKGCQREICVPVALGSGFFKISSPKLIGKLETVIPFHCFYLFSGPHFYFVNLKLTTDKKEGIQSRESIFSMIVFLDSQNKNRGNKVRLDLLKESTI